jgi:thymidine phosphorylase
MKGGRDYDKGKAIAKMVTGKDLTEEETKMVMDKILPGQVTGAQIGSFLTAFSYVKIETLSAECRKVLNSSGWGFSRGKPIISLEGGRR